MLHCRALMQEAEYTLRARIMDKGRSVREFTSKAFKGGDLKDGRIAFTEKWKPGKLWDIHTPQNMFNLQLSLLGAGGKLLDTGHVVRFGFREFWIDGRDFFLNGTRIFLSSVPLDNAQVGAALANYEGAKESLLRLKSFGINFVYTHNYGCQPGSHLGFAEILRAADDVGMLVSFSQPHFGHYEWQAPDADQTNGYARHAEFYVRAAQNHPSVVMYSMSHNATGYSEDMNPDMIDGIKRSARQVVLEKFQARLAGGSHREAPGPEPHHLSSLLGQPRFDAHEQFLPELRPDPGTIRLVRTLGDQGGEAGLHVRVRRAIYLGLDDVPRVVQGETGLREREGAMGVLPGRVEFAVPWGPGLSDQREGEGKSALGSQAVSGRQSLASLGLPLPPGLKRVGRTVSGVCHVPHRQLACLPHLGCVGKLPMGYSIFWKLREGVDRGRKEFKVDWENLQRPGFSPDYIEQRYERMDMAYERSDWIPTAAAQALIRNNLPLLAYIGGKACPLHKQGPQLPSGRNGRKADHHHQQFPRDRFRRVRMVIRPAPGCQPAARKSA